MGVEVVEHSLRRMPEHHYPDIELDFASAKLIHSMDPTRNYITCEISMPALKKFMPLEDHNLIEDTYHYDCMHGMKYIQVNNSTFHEFMNKEGTPFRNERRGNSETTSIYDAYTDREGIDVVRHTVGDRVTTQFFSNKRTLGLLRHDYYMGLLLYGNNPPRDYIRRTPCKKLSPDCDDCPETLAEEVEGWLFDAPEFYPNIEKTFFTYIGENHRLLMGYTLDLNPSFMSGNQYIEPEYYILDLGAFYFQHAEYRELVWEKTILDNRRYCPDELYSYSRVTENKDGGTLATVRDAWTDFGHDMPVAKYRFSDPDSVPKDYWIAITTHDFRALWHADLIRFNARTTAHKWAFNHWSILCSRVNDGFFCGWMTSEVVSDAESSVGTEMPASMVQSFGSIGWGEGEPGSTDSIFTLVHPKLPGYTYEPIVEPLPIRDLF